jgi:cell shape-determining protein MreC
METSQLGGNFPPGIPIGTIKSVSAPPGETPTAMVAANESTSSLNYVAVMLWSAQ